MIGPGRERCMKFLPHNYEQLLYDDWEYLSMGQRSVLKFASDIRGSRSIYWLLIHGHIGVRSYTLVKVLKSLAAKEFILRTVTFEAITILKLHTRSAKDDPVLACPTMPGSITSRRSWNSIHFDRPKNCRVSGTKGSGSQGSAIHHPGIHRPLHSRS